MKVIYGMLICIAIITAIALLQPRVAVKTTGVDTNSVETVQSESPAPVAQGMNIAKTATNRVTVEFNFEPEIK